jgi:hypothetical protein
MLGEPAGVLLFVVLTVLLPGVGLLLPRLLDGPRPNFTRSRGMSRASAIANARVSSCSRVPACCSRLHAT